MTRKNMKGIVGKAKGKDVGPGISFKDENLTTSDEIERAIEEKKKK